MAAAQAELGRVLDEQSRDARRLRQGVRSLARAAAAEARQERRDAIDARRQAGVLAGSITALNGGVQFFASGADEGTQGGLNALFGDQGISGGYSRIATSRLEAAGETYDVNAEGLDAEAGIYRDLADDLGESRQSAEGLRGKVSSQLDETLRAQLEARRLRLDG
ncbi:MAG: hypothetical protein AAF447_09605 [Myxococcota bacterium]